MNNLTGTALRVLRSRYFLKDESGNVLEDWPGLCARVANAVSRAEKNYESDPESIMKWGDRFYAAILSQDFVPNSPTLMNAGTPKGQLSACFLIDVQDNMESIFDAVKDMAMIFKSGGGVGIPLSALREKDALVRSTGGKSSGPISFMRVYNTVAEVVSQGGKRRGALMATLRIDHPDALDFIQCKRNTSEFTSFNISVMLTRAFMDALSAYQSDRTDARYPIIDPQTGDNVGDRSAKETWDLIVDCAHATGEPGIVFIDRINEYHTKHVCSQPVIGTNPCVSGDTWTMTMEGPRQVSALVGVPIELRTRNQRVETDGFFTSGVKEVYRVKTDVGLEVRATIDHTFVRCLPGAEDTEKVPLGELAVGDLLPVETHDTTWPCVDYVDDVGSLDAYLAGVWFGDGHTKRDKPVVYLNKKTEGIDGVLDFIRKSGGCLIKDSDQHYIVEREGLPGVLVNLAVASDKVMTPEIEMQSPRFYKCFLCGFFDTDGSVQGTSRKGYSIRLSQSDLTRLQVVQRMLLRLGIFSRIRLAHEAGPKVMPDGKGGMKEYQTKDNYELIISSWSIGVFNREIGFHNSKKAQRLERVISSYTRGFYRSEALAKVTSIEKCGEEEVYDVQVPGLNVFDANGITVGNCGELPLRPYESCNLGSINLARMVSNGKIDYKKITETVKTAVRFLDDVIDVNVFPLDKIAERTKEVRKIGLGVMGLAEMFAMYGVRYGNTESFDIATNVISHIRKDADEASRELAEERGTYKLSPDGVTRRNGTVMSIAPTGSISMIAGVTGGIEPFFAPVTKRQGLLDGEEFLDVNPYFKRVIDGLFDPGDAAAIYAKLADGESMEEAGVPKEVQHIFPCAHEIDPMAHVQMQGCVQKHVDNAVSKTVNLPYSATKEDVERVLFEAYHNDCKGITVYRDGCRDHQPISTGKKREQIHKLVEQVLNVPVYDEEKIHEEWKNSLSCNEKGYVQPDKRPDSLPGITRKVKTGCGTLFVTISLKDGKPLEIFAHHGKAGVCSQAQCEAIGRLTSMGLRSHLDPAEIAKQLRGITCHQPFGFGGNKVHSCGDGIAQVLLEVLGQGKDDVTGPVYSGSCPECGGSMKSEGGCYVCAICGYEKCS